MLTPKQQEFYEWAAFYLPVFASFIYCLWPLKLLVQDLPGNDFTGFMGYFGFVGFFYLVFYRIIPALVIGIVTGFVLRALAKRLLVKNQQRDHEHR